MGDTITIVARVDARRMRDVDPLMGCLDTLDFLYLTWGGIHQPVTLEAVAKTRLDDVFVVSRLEDSTAEVQLSIAGQKVGELKAVAEILDVGNTAVASAESVLAADSREVTLRARIANPKLWSPGSPHLYTARVRLLHEGLVLDERSVRFGMRDFHIEAGQFLLNRQPIFLRGYGDDCIFPATICPPADKAFLSARLARARDYGFNFVRHHSWTPPAEYLDAADELGMMLQPEFPFAYRWDLPQTTEARTAALKEWEAMIRLNRNHPSIISWCMGNELYDSFDLAPEMYRRAKQLDPTRPVIDSDGCRFDHKARKTLDYLVVQFREGDSIGHRDGKYEIPPGISKPVVGHEMGYFVTLHDFSQLSRFQGGLRPYWLILTQKLTECNGVASVYPDWLSASYKLQATCLKTNLEAARRSRLAGTSVWLFEDYPNCAEGVVDMFGQAKGLTMREFRKFNAPTVLLLDTPANSWWSGSTASIRFVVSRFEDAPSSAATLTWHLRNGTDEVSTGSQSHLAVPSGGLQPLPAFELELPRLAHAVKLTLRARLSDANGSSENEWNFWVFPRELDKVSASDLMVAGFDPLRALYPGATEYKPDIVSARTRLLVTTRLDERGHKFLTTGGRVLLLDPEPLFSVERTDFRLSSWDGGGPSGTIVRTKNPGLRSFPADGWCDLQFYSLIQGSKSILLSEYPNRIDPIIRCIDRPTRLADRAYLFEARVGQGSLLVSGLNFPKAFKENDPAGIYLMSLLICYAMGPEFRPEVSLPISAPESQGYEMIIDIHTHYFRPEVDFGPALRSDLARCAVDPAAWGDVPQRHLETTLAADVAVVFGLCIAQATGWNIPNEAVAAHVARAPERLLFFASIDPAVPDFMAELERCHQDLGAVGVKLAPLIRGYTLKTPAAGNLMLTVRGTGSPCCSTSEPRLPAALRWTIPGPSTSMRSRWISPSSGWSWLTLDTPGKARPLPSSVATPTSTPTSPRSTIVHGSSTTRCASLSNTAPNTRSFSVLIIHSRPQAARFLVSAESITSSVKAACQ